MQHLWIQAPTHSTNVNMNTSFPQADTDSKIWTGSGKVSIPVVAFGRSWLAVDKPSGMSIHNDPGGDLCSLVLAALQAGHLPVVSQDISAMHAAHRIDRDTSGIVIMAADKKTLAHFGAQFTAKCVGKRYLALVHGKLNGSFEGSDWSDWNWPLSAAAAGRRQPKGKRRGLPCLTRWRTLAHSLHYTLIECEPLTGRKHQIRRHAKLAGHAVLGDRRYGSTRSVAYLSRQHDFNRLGLHAHALTIHLPGDVHATTLQSDGMPEAMRQLLEMDR